MNTLISNYVNRVVNDFWKTNIEPVRISFPSMVKKDTRSHENTIGKNPPQIQGDLLSVVLLPFQIW